MSEKHILGLDKITEENNKIPFWLTLVWFLLLSWGIYYLVTYLNIPDQNDYIHKQVLNSSITYTTPREEGFVASSTTVEVKKEDVKVADGASVKLLEEGKTIYDTNCAACHGVSGDGAGPAAVALTPKPRNFVQGQFKYGGDDASLTKTVQNGVKNTAMPAWKDSVNPEQTKAVIAYLKAFKK